MLPALRHIDTWIFDLDNTLYPASADLFSHIDRRMGAFIADLLACDAEEAHRIQKGYYRAHGTTLRGLMDAHDIDPREFLAFVHDVPMDAIVHDARLVAAIAGLPGRKLVFTNGDRDYAERVLMRLGLGESFEAIHDIHACGYLPKPDPRAYASLADALAIDPARALFADDIARNLAPAKAIGMTTLWIDNGSDGGRHDALPHAIDYTTGELGDWLDTNTKDDA
jgi:putative hydrolase of the HAD superfamily